VFKVIKDYYPPQKDTTRELIKSKYLLVKQHDRVGRMADTLEFSNVAFPLARFEDELVDELKKFCPSVLEISDRDGDGHGAGLGARSCSAPSGWTAAADDCDDRDDHEQLNEREGLPPEGKRSRFHGGQGTETFVTIHQSGFIINPNPVAIFLRL
jgi:hypothetical protein